jgi:D-glycero-alpha-D-manno-heptose 1-phosphate guanylyltransferase
MREAVILAGGLGTRLAGVVAERPKAMALIAGRPFLEWQLDHLLRHGVRRFVLALGHRAAQIVDHFGDRYGDAEIVYEVEDAPHGTGGAMRRALGRVRGSGAFALNGDTILLADLDALEGRQRERIVVAVREAADCSRFGVLQLAHDTVVSFLEKGGSGKGFINAGLYWLRRDLFDGFSLPAVFSFERDFLAREISVLHPRAVVATGYFIDIGAPESYLDAQTSLPAALDLDSA